MIDITSTLINPRVDIAFKKIFGVEENKDILISLLNSIVSEADQIDDLELLNPYNERNFKGDKLSIVDIKARNKHDHTYFLIEMQLADEMDYHKRGLYSWARVYSNQVPVGKGYGILKRTVAIHILNFTFIDSNKVPGWIETVPNKYHHRFVLRDKETNVEVFKDIEINTIELQKFAGIDAKDLREVMSQVKSMLDKWVAVLTKHDLLNIEELPEEINTTEIKKAIKVMQEMSMNEIERDTYNAHLDFLLIEAGAFEKKFIEGEEKGRKEGEEKGREVGKAEGREEGIKETKILTAKVMLSEGLDINIISKVTGIAIAELKELETSSV